VPSFKYVGHADPADVPALGLLGVTRGQVVEVDEKRAKGLEGSANWEPVKSAKKAASSTDSQEG
jgi:hypothetical protein